ncbi:hypothetical protein KR018_003939, partial [Drosophila ironensis]
TITLLQCTTAYLTFTNLKCEMLDKKYGNFETCHIKAVNRSHKYIDVYTRLFRVPINNISIQIEPMRMDNGYKPFLINMKFDLCKYLRNPTHRSMAFLRELHMTFVKSSNMNHTCPYDHDIVVEKLWTGNLEKGFLQLLPIPNGEYGIFSKWFTYNIHRATVNVFFKISN